MTRFLGLLLLLAAPALAQHAHHGPHAGNADHARHGFILLGDRQLHLYHLTRFGTPHRYLGVFEVRATDENGRQLDVERIRQGLPENTLLSFLSDEHFDLQDLGTDDGVAFPFRGELYSGYLRDTQNRRLLQRGVTMTRIAVRHFSEVVATASRPRNPRLIQICDTPAGRHYGVHFISGAPNFEELVRIDTLYTGSWDRQDVLWQRCTPTQQGTILTVTSRTGDAPLDGTTDLLRAYSPGLGRAVTLSGIRTLLLDRNAVNPPAATAPPATTVPAAPRPMPPAAVVLPESHRYYWEP